MHKTGRQSLPLFLSHFARPATLQPPFCCSALLLLCPARTYIQDFSSWSVCLSAVPAPIPKLYFCIAHAILSDPVGKTEPNPTQLNPLAHIRTLIPSRLAVHTLRGVREHFDLPCFACCAPLSLEFFSLSCYFLALPPPLSFFKLVSAASSLAPSSTRLPTHCHIHSQPQNRR